MAFVNVRFPVPYGYDPQGGPRFSVMITQSEGGQEARSPAWGGLDTDYGLYEFELDSRPFTGAWGFQNGLWPATPRGDFNGFMAFWNTVAQGQANGFRYNYWFDNYADRAYLMNTSDGTFEGDGSTVEFQLCRQQYAEDDGITSNKKILLPIGTDAVSVTLHLNVSQTGIPDMQQVTTAPLIYANANPITPPLSNTLYTISDTSGRVIFDTAPTPGVTPTATFYFDLPVRFDNDKSPAKYKAGKFEMDSVTLLELRDAL